MNAQKKLDEAAGRIRELSLVRDAQRKELAHAARQVVELRAENAALRQLFEEFHAEIMVQTAGEKPDFSEANEIYRKFKGMLK